VIGPDSTQKPFNEHNTILLARAEVLPVDAKHLGKQLGKKALNTSKRT